MRSSEAKTKWVTRWKYEMTAKPLRRGVWALKDGGYLVRTRVVDPRTGKVQELQRVLRDATLIQAENERVRLQSDARDLVSGRKQTPPQWSSYAASLFKAKVNEGKIKSAKGRERWSSTLARLIPELGHFFVDELRPAHLIAWRDKLAVWMHEGMPSIRKSDQGKKKLVSLAPATANGWMSIVKVICGAMTNHYELGNDPSDVLEYFHVPRTYTREQPNALAPEQAGAFLAKMKELYPQHYAMTFLGFAIGSRPSTLRPLRRRGQTPDLLWEEGILLLRRSHSMGKEIMDQTKTALDQEIPLPPAVMEVLREHVASLDGAMGDSDYLFPSVIGGLRARSVLDQPFRQVVQALKWDLKLTPKAMRRTFQDLARRANIHDLVTRAISGHTTERMQRHYSTAQNAEILHAVGRVAGFLGGVAGETPEGGHTTH